MDTQDLSRNDTGGTGKRVGMEYKKASQLSQFHTEIRIATARIEFGVKSLFCPGRSNLGRYLVVGDERGGCFTFSF